MIRVRRRDKAPNEFRRASCADNDRIFADGFFQRPINMPLIDRAVNVISMNLNFLAPVGLFSAEPIKARRIFFRRRLFLIAR